MPPSNHASPSGVSRRSILRAAAVGTLSTAMTPIPSPAQAPQSAAQPDFRIRNRRIRQSIMGWTFNPMPTPELARHCRDIGLVAMEGVDPKHYPFIRELGLEISLVGSHGFANGPVQRTNHPQVIKALRDGIDRAVQCKSRKVITFTGMREPGMDDATAAQNCVDCWKQVVGYAEEKGITLCLEHLNSRDSSHPMKGHPGYFGDHVDACVDLIRKVGSPNFRLLFDIYHVAIMDGDVIRRLRAHKEFIAHIHTAGVPGRGELDETQEVNYPAVMRAILDIGYDGYVAQEFLPTWPDKVLALRHAAMVCDV